MEVSDLLDSVDIVDYLSQFLELEEKNGEYWALSPFTNEKTPSFSVRRETGKFYDFSSGLGGNLITFIKAYDKCSGSEAVKKLSEYAGVDDKDLKVRKKLDATTRCRRFSPPRTHKKENKSKVLSPQIMEKYEDNPAKLEAWRREGISDASLKRFGVKYDAFSDRLVYPIKNEAGEIVNVGGRTLDPDYKAKGLRKYTYFYSWGTINTIYGLSDNLEYIKKKNEIILFEGCKSVLLADTWGIRNTGAILTSHLSANQMKLLAKLGVHVTFALDKEVDERKDRNIARLRQYNNVFLLRDVDGLLDDKDAPVDKGQEVFIKLYESKIRYR